MSRDQRVNDNWAMLYACEQAAKKGAPVAICFNLVSWKHSSAPVHLVLHLSAYHSWRSCHAGTTYCASWPVRISVNLWTTVCLIPLLCANPKNSGACLNCMVRADAQVSEYVNAGARHFGFMLRGLKELAPRAAALDIPFFLFRGDPAVTVPAFVRDAGAALLVTDYAALRLGRQWRAQVQPKP